MTTLYSLQTLHELVVFGEQCVSSDKYTNKDNKFSVFNMELHRFFHDPKQNIQSLYAATNEFAYLKDRFTAAVFMQIMYENFKKPKDACIVEKSNIVLKYFGDDKKINFHLVRLLYGHLFVYKFMYTIPIHEVKEFILNKEPILCDKL